MSNVLNIIRRSKMLY